MTSRLNAEERHRSTVEKGFVTDAHEKKYKILQNRETFNDKYLRNQQKYLKFGTISVLYIDIVKLTSYTCRL